MNKSLKLFYQFLEANGALIDWEQNVVEYQIKHNGYGRAGFFHKQLSTERHQSGWGFIMAAFCWRETPQGHTYWSILDSKWNAHLNENI